MNNSFDQYASLYDAWFMQNPNLLLSEVRLVARTLQGARHILSVGCGSGLFEKILRDDFGIDITDGIEPADGMAEIARHRGVNVSVTTAEEGISATVSSTPSCLTAARVTSPTFRRLSRKPMLHFPKVDGSFSSTCPKRAATA